jgi:hypothetical protein
MTRAGTLLEKEAGLSAIFQGEEHPYVRCILADTNDPTRHLECRVLDVEDIPTEPGQSITLEVIHVVTDRKNGKVRFDCHFVA